MTIITTCKFNVHPVSVNILQLKENIAPEVRSALLATSIVISSGAPLRRDLSFTLSIIKGCRAGDLLHVHYIVNIWVNFATNGPTYLNEIVPMIAYVTYEIT